MSTERSLKKKKKVKKLDMFSSTGRTFQNTSIANIRAMKRLPDYRIERGLELLSKARHARYVFHRLEHMTSTNATTAQTERTQDLSQEHTVVQHRKFHVRYQLNTIKSKINISRHGKKKSLDKSHAHG